MSEMSLVPSLLLLTAGIGLVLFGWWRQRAYRPGRLPLIPPFLLQLIGLVLTFAVAAHMIADLSGITWTPPYRR